MNEKELKKILFKEMDTKEYLEIKEKFEKISEQGFLLYDLSELIAHINYELFGKDSFNELNVQVTFDEIKFDNGETHTKIVNVFTEIDEKHPIFRYRIIIRFGVDIPYKVADFSTYGKTPENSISIWSIFEQEEKEGTINQMLQYKNENILIDNYKDKMQYLEPKHDSRNSFYKKARVYTIENVKVLVSYNTIVCVVCDDLAIIYGYYSYTTRRHIHEFLLQNNFDDNIQAKELKKLSHTKKDYKLIEK